ncbi:MAG: zinc ribbon domain-containing protein [Thermoanaerobaculia bacterium]
MTTIECPDCGAERIDTTKVCETCGAPPFEEQRSNGLAGVRSSDLEPYVTLRYIAGLFKILAVLIVVVLIGEVITGLMTEGSGAIVTLLAEATRLIVVAGLMWAGGDFVVLVIDAGHDLRVARILLGRINARLHDSDTVIRSEEPRTPPEIR